MLHIGLQQLHPLIGYDLHQPWPPGSPVISPAPLPYFSAHIMAGTIPGTQKYAPTVLGMCGFLMCGGTDIGMMIPHIGAPSVILPVEMLASSSKSHFCASTVQMKDNTQAAGMMGTALAGVTNINLDCGTPIPAPFGTILALGTVGAGMTIGDFLRGALSMAADMLIGAILNRVGAGLGNVASRVASRVGPRLAATRAGAWLSAYAAREGTMLARSRAAYTAYTEGAERALGAIESRLGPEARHLAAHYLPGDPIDSVTESAGEAITEATTEAAGEGADSLGQATDSYLHGEGVDEFY